MDLLQRSQLQKAGDLIRDAARDTTHTDERSLCTSFLDMPRKDLSQYSLLRAIRNSYDSISRSASNLGALRANQSGGNTTGGHHALNERLGEASGFGGIEGEAHRALAEKLGPLMHGGQFYVPADFLYRDLQVAVGSGGGFLVGAKNVSFIDSLRNASVVFRLGATRLPGQRENIVLPKQVGNSTIAWLSTETSQAAESTSSFTQVSGTPKTAASYSEISEKLLKQSNPAAEGIVTRGLAADLAVGVDAAAVNGTGANGQPTGILQTSGIGSVSGTALGYAGLVEAQTDIADNNAVLDPNALGYCTTPLIAQVLKGRQRFTSTDSPLWKGAIHAGEIEGVQALSTKNMPANTLLYGDWSSVIVAEWGVLIVELNPFADFRAGIVGVRALWSVDVLVQQPVSFTPITSIT